MSVVRKNSPCFRDKVELFDYSNPYMEQYKEIPPLATNEDGEIINLSTKKKLVRIDDINIQEKIQSFYETSDLYHVLTTFAKSQDPSLIFVKNDGQFGDFSGVSNLSPQDIQEAHQKAQNAFNSLSKEEQDAVLAFLNNIKSAQNNKTESESEEIKLDGSQNEGGEK